jgi:anionic cell wall polymer biosynthesis LytR-Cps2A-Psr (LCP) family protein
VNVPRPVLDRVSPPEEGQDWIRIDLQAGRQKLTALEAFAYVRARSQSSDYERIRRQRCVIAALARQADAVRLLAAFPRIAGAARRNVSTDIPRRVLPELVELVAGVDQRKVVSLGFVPPDYSSRSVGAGYPVPDIPAIRAATRKAIGPGGVRGAGRLGGELCA